MASFSEFCSGCENGYKPTDCIGNELIITQYSNNDCTGNILNTSVIPSCGTDENFPYFEKSFFICPNQNQNQNPNPSNPPNPNPNIN